jgi:alkylhydroperoxidase family enzyme
MQRIPLVDPDTLEGELAEAYKGPSGKATFFRLMAHAPTAYAAYRPFIQAIFARLDLPPVDRELAVLLAMDIEQGEYEWAQHVVIGKAMGITDAQIDAIKRRAFDEAGLTEKQAALLHFTEQVTRDVRVDDATFEAAARHYSHRELIETIFTVGNYMLLARITEVARLPLDGLTGIESLRAAEAQAKAEASR